MGDKKTRTSCEILVISLGGGYGGAERSLEELLSIIAEGKKIVVVAEHPIHAFALGELSPHSISVVRVKGGRSLWRMGALALKFLFLVWTLNPKTVITNTNKSAVILAGCLPLLSRKIRKFVFVRDFQWIYARWCFAQLNGHVKIVAPCKVLFDKWPSQYGVLPDQDSRQVLPNPYRIPCESNDINRNEILCLASQTRWKGIDILIRAMPKVLASCPSARLKIIGEDVDSQYAQELDLLIAELGLGRKVVRKKFVQNPEVHLRHCSCVVNASLPRLGGPEVFGRTVIEAWAFSKPVVATKGGGPEALIQDGYNGLLVAPEDPAALGDALTKVLLEKSFADYLGKNGHQEFLDKYSDIAVSMELKELLVGKKSENESF